MSTMLKKTIISLLLFFTAFSLNAEAVSIQGGLSQPLLGGWNVAGTYYGKKFLFEYSHGTDLHFDRMGGAGLSEAERKQDLKVHVPYTTGFGIGYLFTPNFDLRLEFKELFLQSSIQYFAGRTLSFSGSGHSIRSSRERKRRGELGASPFSKRKLYGRDSSESGRIRISLQRALRHARYDTSLQNQIRGSRSLLSHFSVRRQRRFDDRAFDSFLAERLDRFSQSRRFRKSIRGFGSSQSSRSRSVRKRFDRLLQTSGIKTRTQNEL